jgi:hypothetical protein
MKKKGHYINGYEIRLFYNALSKGGDIRIYIPTFSVYFYLNSKLMIVKEDKGG